MKLSKKLIALAALIAMLGSSTNKLTADECCDNNYGCGYQDCCTSTNYLPAIALGTIAIVAIIAVAAQDPGGHHHHHSHSHSHSHN